MPSSDSILRGCDLLLLVVTEITHMLVNNRISIKKMLYLNLSTTSGVRRFEEWFRLFGSRQDKKEYIVLHALGIPQLDLSCCSVRWPVLLEELQCPCIFLWFLLSEVVSVVVPLTWRHFQIALFCGRDVLLLVITEITHKLVNNQLHIK